MGCTAAITIFGEKKKMSNIDFKNLTCKQTSVPILKTVSRRWKTKFTIADREFWSSEELLVHCNTFCLFQTL